MTNINPDNLIKAEPYLMVIKPQILMLGFYKKQDGKLLLFENNILLGTQKRTEEKVHINRIDKLVHLKRGEVIK